MNIIESRKLRIWWIPQVPMKPFRYDVPSVEEASRMLDMLPKYDIFQLENRIKPDYCNAGGLEVLEGDGWEDWSDADGNDIDEVINMLIP